MKQGEFNESQLELNKDMVRSILENDKIIKDLMILSYVVYPIVGFFGVIFFLSKVI